MSAFFFFLVAPPVLLLWFSSSINGSKKNRASPAPPEAGGGWPFIGHVHLLGGPKPPHIVLGDIADKYGPVFTIRMGVHRALVVSNWETAKQCLTTNDRVFATRPRTLALDIFSYDGASVGFTEYGPYWRHIRKLSTVHLLSTHRIELLKGFRETEVRESVRELYKLWEKNSTADKVSVDMRRWVGDTTSNIILKIVVGKRLGYTCAAVDGVAEESWRKYFRDVFDLSGMFTVSDALPFLRFLDIGGLEKQMKKTMKELDGIFEGWLAEHKEKRSGSKEVKKGEEDFMGLMLSILEEDDGLAAVADGRHSDTINKATCLAMVLAASDTTAVTMTWALSLLMNHPNVLQKVTKELDLHIGRERQVQEADLQNLVYLQAIIKETMRLYPAAPLSVPHKAMEDCTVDGYHIPAGTQLLVNIRKIQRDPRVWPDPDEFRPERFLTTHKDVDFEGQNFEFIPFGSGRRMCPGVGFARPVMQLTLATLLHGFDFGTLSGEPVDMIESIGLTNLRATPLELRLKPRLSPNLYK